MVYIHSVCNPFNTYSNPCGGHERNVPDVCKNDQFCQPYLRGSGAIKLRPPGGNYDLGLVQLDRNLSGLIQMKPKTVDLPYFLLHAADFIGLKSLIAARFKLCKLSVVRSECSCVQVHRCVCVRVCAYACVCSQQALCQVKYTEKQKISTIAYVQKVILHTAIGFTNQYRLSDSVTRLDFMKTWTVLHSLLFVVAHHFGFSILCTRNQEIKGCDIKGMYET